MSHDTHFSFIVSSEASCERQPSKTCQHDAIAMAGEDLTCHGLWLNDNGEYEEKDYADTESMAPEGPDGHPFVLQLRFNVSAPPGLRAPSNSLPNSCMSLHTADVCSAIVVRYGAARRSCT